MRRRRNLGGRRSLGGRRRRRGRLRRRGRRLEMQRGGTPRARRRSGRRSRWTGLRGPRRAETGRRSRPRTRGTRLRGARRRRLLGPDAIAQEFLGLVHGLLGCEGGGPARPSLNLAGSRVIIPTVNRLAPDAVVQYRSPVRRAEPGRIRCGAMTCRFTVPITSVQTRRRSRSRRPADGTAPFRRGRCHVLSDAVLPV